MERVKLCKDCKHYGIDPELRARMCLNVPDLIEGEIKRSSPAHLQRLGGFCGPDARYWEPKEAKVPSE